MARITVSYPAERNLLIEGTVEAGVFGDKSDGLREFVREYFEDHENERIATAVALSEREQITLGDARDSLTSTAGRRRYPVVCERSRRNRCWIGWRSVGCNPVWENR